MGKFSKMLFNGGKLAGSMQIDRRFMVMKKKLSSGGCLPLSRAIYMYMTIIFKDLLLNHLANQNQTLSGASLGKGCES